MFQLQICNRILAINQFLDRHFWHFWFREMMSWTITVCICIDDRDNYLKYLIFVCLSFPWVSASTYEFMEGNDVLIKNCWRKWNDRDRRFPFQNTQTLAMNDWHCFLPKLKHIWELCFCRCPWWWFMWWLWNVLA